MNNTVSSSKGIAFITGSRKASASKIARQLSKNHDLIALVGMRDQRAGGAEGIAFSLAGR